MDSKWRKKQIMQARKNFKDFHAEFKDYGELQTLDWRHKCGSNNYHVHYIFDTKQQYMHVSGDLGSASFCLTWEPTLQNMSNRINDPWYIIEKMECATDDFVYPEEYVRADIEKRYKDLVPQRDDYPEDENGRKKYEYDLEEFTETIESFIDAHDYHHGFCAYEFDRLEELQDLDLEWYEGNHGRCISPRVYFWLVGLQMAWEQVKQENKDETDNYE